MTARSRAYRWSALSIGSNVPLPLPPAEPAPIDLRIRVSPASEPIPITLQWYHTWRRNEGVYAMFARAGRGVYLVRFEQIADVWIDVPADTIRVVPKSSLDEAIAVTLTQALPLAASASGRIVLHASAVTCGNGAVAFVGAPGAGKSTIAAAFGRAGCCVLADDNVLYANHFSSPGIFPNTLPLRLAADAAAVYGDGTYEFDRRGKMKVATVQSVMTGDQPIMLSAVCVLDNMARDAANLHQLPQREALAALLPHVYRLDIEDRAALTRELEQLAALAVRTPVFVLTGPRGLDRLGEITAAVMNRFDT